MYSSIVPKLVSHDLPDLIPIPVPPLDTTKAQLEMIHRQIVTVHELLGNILKNGPWAHKRTKAKAGVNESADIEFIINAIHTKSLPGMKFIESFNHSTDATLLDARARNGSNRATHYDFDILVRSSDETELWKHVEHKGAQAGQIKEHEKPWLAGVQFYNGGCEKYTIANNYAKIHYDLHIASGNLRRKWNLTTPIPSFDDWWKNDCCSQGNPKTAFGIELKDKVRKLGGSLLHERIPVIEALPFTEEVQQQLIKEVLPLANTVLQQKDYWLTVRGDLKSDTFEHKWYPKFTIDTVNNVIITKKMDVEFDFHCSDDFKFKGILRWGKGAGFSNLRIDLK